MALLQLKSVLSRYLVEVHEISWQQFLQELGFFVLDSLQDEFVVAGQVEDTTRGPRVAQLTHGFVANGHLEFE